MAVEAQYPSNVLLRGLQQVENQRANDYDNSMLVQSGEGARAFLDQPHLISNNPPPGNSKNLYPVNNLNPRKRGSDEKATQAEAMNSRFHSPPPNAMVSTGLCLSFFEQQQNHPTLCLVQPYISNQIKYRTDEIDQFLRAQFDEMRRTLSEKGEGHYRALIDMAEEAVAKMMMEKDTEVENAFHRNSELQAMAAHYSTEAQVWQARAKAQEATATALQAQLQNAIMTRGCAHKQYESLTCASGEGLAGDAESVYIDPERVELRSAPSCKACQKRVASVVVLPCRHLSVCVKCEGVVSSCPLCFSFKRPVGVHALLSLPIANLAQAP